MKKLLYTVFTLLACYTLALGQAKKPSLMVVPGEVWCNQNGYTQVFDNQGVTEVIPDYKAALQSDKDLMNVISKINILMADRGFPLQDLSASIRSIQNISAEDNLITSKSTGANIVESPLDKLRRTAKADILLEVDWTINTTGPKKSITYNLRGIDAYTNKQIAGAQGTGAPSFSAEVPVLLEEAILVNMDQFNNQLQAHFDDLFENGREIALDVRVFDNDMGIDLETEFDGYELTEIIDDWMAMNTVNHRYSKADATDNYIIFNQVRIPLYRDNGMPMDTEHFARNLMRFLRQAPYNIPCKIINRGLGRCLIVIGEK